MFELVKERGIHWKMFIYITSIHLFAIISLFMIPYCKWQTLVWAVSLWPISGFGITGIAHRFVSHKSYKGNIQYRILGMLLNGIANQGSLYTWCITHRIHHKCSEKQADPHNATLGFFYSHMGWLMLHKSKEYKEERKKLNIDDLLNDSVIMFQKKWDPWLNFFLCFVFPTVVAVYGWKETVVNSLMISGMLRYVVVLHFTWLVNSLAHMKGHRPYTRNKNGPAENFLVTLVSLSEGNHDWHHLYPYDYAASELCWSQLKYNPTKMIIDFFALLGWVTDRKRALKAWEHKKQLMFENEFVKID